MINKREVSLRRSFFNVFDKFQAKSAKIAILTDFMLKNNDLFKFDI